MKIVIMIVIIFLYLVLYMEQPEIFIQISCFFLGLERTAHSFFSFFIVLLFLYSRGVYR